MNLLSVMKKLIKEKFKMKRQEVINSLIEYDLDAIFSNHPERTVTDMLENGCVGYSKWTDEELEEAYNGIYCNDDIEEEYREEKIKIEKD